MCIYDGQYVAAVCRRPHLPWENLEATRQRRTQRPEFAHKLWHCANARTKAHLEKEWLALSDRYGGECPVQSLDTWQLWSQRYTRGQYHGSHNHGMMNISCVLFVEFDEKEHIPTTFYSPFPNPYYGTISKAAPPVSEGDIIAFPSLLLHESPVSPSDKERTIMSFNIPLR